MIGSTNITLIPRRMSSSNILFGATNRSMATTVMSWPSLRYRNWKVTVPSFRKPRSARLRSHFMPASAESQALSARGSACQIHRVPRPERGSGTTGGCNRRRITITSPHFLVTLSQGENRHGPPLQTCCLCLFPSIADGCPLKTDSHGLSLPSPSGLQIQRSKRGRFTPPAALQTLLSFIVIELEAVPLRSFSPYHPAPCP